MEIFSEISARLSVESAERIPSFHKLLAEVESQTKVDIRFTGGAYIFVGTWKQIEESKKMMEERLSSPQVHSAKNSVPNSNTLGFRCDSLASSDEGSKADGFLVADLSEDTAKVVNSQADYQLKSEPVVQETSDEASNVWMDDTIGYISRGGPNQKAVQHTISSTNFQFQPVSITDLDAGDAPPDNSRHRKKTRVMKNRYIVLKYKYRENQWSPLNIEGKKQYDRSFLLQLQSAPESLIKPTRLPKLPDVILDTPITGNERQFAHPPRRVHTDFTPGYVKSSPSGKQGMNIKRSSAQKGGRGPGVRVIPYHSAVE